jgi:hypothetical protein
MREDRRQQIRREGEQRRLRLVEKRAPESLGGELPQQHDRASNAQHGHRQQLKRQRLHQRNRHQRHRVGGELDLLDEFVDPADRSAARVRHTLRPARGSRREEHRAQKIDVVWMRMHPRRRRRRKNGGQPVVLVDAENLSHVGAVTSGNQRLPLLAKRHDDRCTASLQAVRDLVGAISKVERDGNEAGTKAGEVRDECFGTVRQPERHAIAVTASTTHEVGREMIARSHEHRIREPSASAMDRSLVWGLLERGIRDLIEQHDSGIVADYGCAIVERALRRETSRARPHHINYRRTRRMVVRWVRAIVQS